MFGWYMTDNALGLSYWHRAAQWRARNDGMRTLVIFVAAQITPKHDALEASKVSGRYTWPQASCKWPEFISKRCLGKGVFT